MCWYEMHAVHMHAFSLYLSLFLGYILCVWFSICMSKTNEKDIFSKKRRRNTSNKRRHDKRKKTLTTSKLPTTWYGCNELTLFTVMYWAFSFVFSSCFYYCCCGCCCRCCCFFLVFALASRHLPLHQHLSFIFSHFHALILCASHKYMKLFNEWIVKE